MLVFLAFQTPPDVEIKCEVVERLSLQRNCNVSAPLMRSLAQVRQLLRSNYFTIFNLRAFKLQSMEKSTDASVFVVFLQQSSRLTAMNNK